MRSLAIGVLLVALVLSMEPVLGVFELEPLARVTVGALVLAVVLAWASVRAALPAPTASAVLVLGYLGGGLAVVGMPWRAEVGLAQAFRALVGGMITSWKDVLTLNPPLGDIPGLLVAPWLLSYVGTVTIVLLALRTGRLAAWAGLIPVLSLVVTLVLADAEPHLPAVIGAVVAVLCLIGAGALRGRLQLRRVVALATLVGVAVASGVVLPAALGSRDRLVVRELVQPPFNPGDYESPLATYRSFLKADQAEMFTVTGGSTAFPVRLAAMDSYDGIVWTTTVASPDDGGGTDSGDFRRVPGVLSTDAATAATGTERTLEFTIGELEGIWLPTSGAVREFTLPETTAWDGLRYNVATSTGVYLPGVRPQLSYSVQAVVRDPINDDALTGVPVSDVDLGEVAHAPDIVEVLAREWIGSASTPIEIARTLEQRFAASGWYSDGLSDQTPAGHGADRMTALLEADHMVGNAEQYASAMALMARSLGLPARVVLGFVPQVPVEIPAEGEAGATTTVVAEDATAWVEIPFEGFGWIPFFPTPDRNRTPDLSQSETDPQSQPQVTQPRPTQEPPTSEPTLQPSDVRAPDRPQEEEEETVAVAAIIAAGLGGLVLLLALPLLAVLVVKGWRRRRRRHASGSRVATQGAWADLVSVLRDTRRDPDPSASRFEVAVTVGAGGPQRLAALADSAQFAPRDPEQEDVTEAWREADAARRGLLSDLSLWRRWRARVSTRSLRRRPGQGG